MKYDLQTNMKTTDLRLKFVRFINRKIARTELGTIPPKWVKVIHSILFPLRAFYEKQSGIKYDWGMDIYTINGVELTGKFIAGFNSKCKKGHAIAWNDPAIVLIMDALGIDHSKVKSFCLRVNTGEVVTVEVEYLMDRSRVADIGRVLHTYRLEQIDREYLQSIHAAAGIPRKTESK